MQRNDRATQLEQCTSTGVRSLYTGRKIILIIYRIASISYTANKATRM